MSYHRNRRGLGADLPSACDEGSDHYDADVCAEFAKPPNAIESVLSWVGGIVRGGSTPDDSGGAAAAVATNANGISMQPTSNAASVAGIPIIPVALGLGAVWFFFLRKGK